MAFLIYRWGRSTYTTHIVALSLEQLRAEGVILNGIIISNVEMRNINMAFGAIGDCGSHPDDSFDHKALPDLDQITLQSVIGSNITMAGSFTGLAESPFTSLCLFNVSLTIHATLSSWTCSNVVGFSESVSTEPCPELESTSVCYSLLNSYGKSRLMSTAPSKVQFYGVKRDCSTAYGRSDSFQ